MALYFLIIILYQKFDCSVLNLISEIPIARKKAHKFCNARHRQLLIAAAIRGGRKLMGAAASTEVHGSNNSEIEKWDLCSGGNDGATADDGRGREGEAERRSCSIEFAGDVFVDSHHHNLAVAGVDCSFLTFLLNVGERCKSFVSIDKACGIHQHFHVKFLSPFLDFLYPVLCPFQLLSINP